MSVPSRDTFAMKRLPWLIAAVAVAALAVTLLWKRSEPAPTVAVAPSPSTQPATETPDAALRRLQGSGLPADPSMLGGMRNRTPMTAQQAEAKRNDKLARLEAGFKADRPDPVGGGKTEQALETVLTGSTMKGTGMVPKDASIDCKATSCRITGSFAKSGDAEDWGLFYLTASAQQLSRADMVTIPGPNGSAEVHVFATRATGH